MADNPNIGKVVTGADGAQFDMTQATPAVKGLPTSGPNAFINGNTGMAMQQVPRAELDARYQARRSLFDNQRAELREYKASEAAKPLEVKMRETGRSESFINAHKNDTPQMQSDFNKAYKANPGPDMTIAKPAPAPTFAPTPAPVTPKMAPPPSSTMMLGKPAAPATLMGSPQFNSASKPSMSAPKFNFTPSISATSTATMSTPATNIFGKSK
jgi:hypothetical protein